MKTATIKRRSLLNLPVIGAGLALATPAVADETTDALTALVDELERYQGWAPHSVAMAKAYAAYRIRQAVGMPLPDPKDAQAHIDMQRGQYEAYRKSYFYEKHIADGEEVNPPNETLIG